MEHPYGYLLKSLINTVYFEHLVIYPLTHLAKDDLFCVVPMMTLGLLSQLNYLNKPGLKYR